MLFSRRINWETLEADFHMGLLNLFITASVPVLNVLLLTGVGSISATHRIGILGKDATKHLNNVVFFVFNPALVASNLSQTITLESMVLLWFMPINLLLNFVIGSALGWVVIQITNAPTHLRGVILASCSAGNVGNLLLILVPAMCREKGSPLGSPDVCGTYGLAYASLSMAIGTILQWSYVYNIVRISLRDKEDKMSNNIPKVEFPEESQETKSLLLHSCTPEKAPRLNKMKNLMRKLSGVVHLKKMFAPASIGVIIGFIIGAIPQIREAIVGQDAPLRVIQDSAALLGNGTIPSLILITGGNLTKGLHGPGVKSTLIFGVAIVRYVALPLFGATIVKGAIHLGLVNPDPLYQFILLLQHAVPPAMNIASMIQMFEVGEGELSVIFLWTYAVASVALTLWLTLFLWLVS